MTRHAHISVLILTLLLAVSCRREDTATVIFTCDDYTVWVDSIVEAEDVIKPRMAEFPAGYPRFEAPQRVPEALCGRAMTAIASMPVATGAYSADGDDVITTAEAAYATTLSLAMLDARRAKALLLSRVNGGSVVGDTLAGNPHALMADRAIWGIAAWDVYMATGDRRWLQMAYNVLVNTLREDFDSCYSSYHKLLTNQAINSRQLDEDERQEPLMELKANVVAAHACRVVGLMREALEIESDPVADKLVAMAPQLRRQINTLFWIPDKGYYAQYLYDRDLPEQSERTDNLAQALSVIWGIAYPEMAKSLIERTPVTYYGVPAQSPPGIVGIYTPLAQGFWNLAAAYDENLDALSAGVAAMYLASAVGSDDSLYAYSTEVATVLRVYMGISLTADGMLFRPVVPTWLAGVKHLRGLAYRDATIDISISGTGTIIQDYRVDGVSVKGNPIFPADMSGHHRVDITMADDHSSAQTVNFFNSLQ